MKKKIIFGLAILMAIGGVAMAEVTYCVSVKCSVCKDGNNKGKVYEVMSISGKDQRDCENKAKDYVCSHLRNNKKAVSAKGYCPKIED